MLSSIAFILSLWLASRMWVYDYPLSCEAIREAYFLETRQAGSGPVFLPKYSHVIPDLAVGDSVSRVRIATPFFQAAERASDG
jgi:hypothetical protein